MTPKHAHFLIDFYGKLCANKTEGMKVLRAIVRMWHGAEVTALLKEFEPEIRGLPGYSLEYILYALSWILEQEDINFTQRPERKQRELDEICGRQGSQLAVSLLCDVANGTHPVEALLRANLDISPRRIQG